MCYAFDGSRREAYVLSAKQHRWACATDLLVAFRLTAGTRRCRDMGELSYFSAIPAHVTYFLDPTLMRDERYWSRQNDMDSVLLYKEEGIVS